MSGIRNLSGLLAGSLCPRMKLSIPPAVNMRHNSVKMNAELRLRKHLSRLGLRLLATAGVRTEEASVTVRIGGNTYRGRPDILALAEANNRYTLVIVEVKTSDEASKSISTIIQASVYAVPAYSCLKLPQVCKVTSQGMRLNLNAKHGTIQATLNISVSQGKLPNNKISGLKVFTAGPTTLRDITESSLMIIEDLIHTLAAYNASWGAIVPGPWCRYCECFHNGECAAGLVR